MLDTTFAQPTLPDFCDCAAMLEWELKNRQRRNARYSLRAFARDLRVSPSFLSEVLAGKYQLSHAKAEDVAERLRFDEPMKSAFIAKAIAHGGYHARSRDGHRLRA